ncbi:MAG: hypothetical protein ABR592_07880 [Nitriliruptorales bacterium]
MRRVRGWAIAGEVHGVHKLLRGSLRQAELPRAGRGGTRALTVLGVCGLLTSVLVVGSVVPRVFTRPPLVALRTEHIEGGRGG